MTILEMFESLFTEIRFKNPWGLVIQSWVELERKRASTHEHGYKAARLMNIVRFSSFHLLFFPKVSLQLSQLRKVTSHAYPC
jgi:hypothetical protein